MTHKAIAIGRQFGSGGREIAVETAKRLGIRCYDKELIALAAIHGNLNHAWLTDFDENAADLWSNEVAYNHNPHRPEGQSVSEILFNLQRDTIRTIAAREDAVFVGRCADHILRDMQEVRLLTVFIAAPFSARVRRKMQVMRLGEKRAEAAVRAMDAQRSLYYQCRTGQLWGDPGRFDLYLDSDSCGREELVNTILSAYRRLDEETAR